MKKNLTEIVFILTAAALCPAWRQTPSAGSTP